MPENKKKSPLKFIALGFIVIVILMFLANSRTELLHELKPPRGGVEKLYSKGNSLIAVSQTNNISIWNWNDLEARPFKTSIQADKSTILSEDSIAWIPLAVPSMVVLTDIKTKKEKNKLRLPYNQKCEQLSASSNGKYVALALIDKKDDSEKPANIRIEMIPQDFSRLKHIVTIKNQNDNVSIRTIAIADNGQFIAMAGKKNGTGWITVIDIAGKKQLWQLGSELSPELTELAFSPDSDTIYTAGVGITVYALKSDDGSVVDNWKTEAYKTVANVYQRITDIDLSADGQWMAVADEPSATAWIWNVKNSKEPKIISTGNKHLFGLAFSTDLSLLATSEMRADQKIRVWPMPEN